MRYAQGGGLTAERRAFRERLRREGRALGPGDDTTVVARDLRVTVRSVQAVTAAKLRAAAISPDSPPYAVPHSFARPAGPLSL